MAIELARPAHRTQITKAVLRLRELIFNGRFSPGERMSELPLVDLLGVSRTPLRLALAELEHEGLLRGLPGGGYVVREFTQGDVRDAIELRGVLEGTAARFAAERGAAARDLASLRATNETIKTLVHRADYESFERYLVLNESFHARLLKMARSPLLVRSLEGIVSLPFAGPSALVFAQAELPGVARHPRHRLPPPHGPHRRHRAPSGRAGREPGPRARAAGAGQPRDRGRAPRRARAYTRRLADRAARRARARARSGARADPRPSPPEPRAGHPAPPASPASPAGTGSSTSAHCTAWRAAASISSLCGR